jgi:hypothetical protein
MLSGGRVCPESNQVKQLTQWSHCLKLINSFEAETGNKFDAVVKLRPDDLWFGPMVPWCALNLRHQAYISRQQKRWSDQFFIIPRSVATLFMDIVETDLRPRCGKGDEQAHVRIDGSPPFEDMVFHCLKRYSAQIGVNVQGSALPRVVSKIAETKPDEVRRQIKKIHDVCGRFMWFSDKEMCASAILGKREVPFSLPAAEKTMN